MATTGTNMTTTTHHESLTTRPPKNSFLLRRASLTRRRKVQSVRLGGKKKRKGGFVLLRLLKKVKLRWLKLQYSCMLKKLRNYYHSVVKDLIEAGATIETLQQRIMMETYFTVPGMGISPPSVPYYAAPNSGPY